MARLAPRQATQQPQQGACSSIQSRRRSFRERNFESAASSKVSASGRLGKPPCTKPPSPACAYLTSRQRPQQQLCRLRRAPALAVAAAAQ